MLCCAYPGYLLGFKVYLGKDAETNKNSAQRVVDQLINKADLINCEGRILYSDNWYTSTRLANYLYETYHCLFIGTMVTNESKD